MKKTHYFRVILSYLFLIAAFVIYFVFQALWVEIAFLAAGFVILLSAMHLRSFSHTEPVKESKPLAIDQDKKTLTEIAESQPKSQPVVPPNNLTIEEVWKEIEDVDNQEDKAKDEAIEHDEEWNRFAQDEIQEKHAGNISASLKEKDSDQGSNQKFDKVIDQSQAAIKSQPAMGQPAANDESKKKIDHFDQDEKDLHNATHVTVAASPDFAKIKDDKNLEQKKSQMQELTTEHK